MLTIRRTLLFLLGTTLLLTLYKFLEYSTYTHHESDTGNTSSLAIPPQSQPHLPMSDVVAFLRAEFPTRNPSKKGRQYRVLLCAQFRNDYNIVEYIIRSLMAGFSHIVLYDDNRVTIGYDQDVSAVVLPFVLAGLVTIIPKNTTLMTFVHELDSGKSVCKKQWAHKSDWIMMGDTDEYLYIEGVDETEGELPVEKLISWMEEYRICCVKVRWRNMYGETYIRRPEGTLLEAFPRVCGYDARHHKTIIDPTKCDFRSPHVCSCESPYEWVLHIPKHNGTLEERKRFVQTDELELEIEDEVKLKENTEQQKTVPTATPPPPPVHKYEGDLPPFEVYLLHYYSKSMEEQLIKIEQTIQGGVKNIYTRYSHIIPCSDKLAFFNYTIPYITKFLNIHHFLRDNGLVDVRKLLSPPSMLEKSISDFNLYLYFKWRILQNFEWDEQKYVNKHNLKMSIEPYGSKFLDGLHHFIVNFPQGARGWWIYQNTSLED